MAGGLLYTDLSEFKSQFLNLHLAECAPVRQELDLSVGCAEMTAPGSGVWALQGEGTSPPTATASLGPVSACLPFGLAEPGLSGPGASGLQDLGPSASPGPSAAPHSPPQGALSWGSLWNRLMYPVSLRGLQLLP